MLAACALILTVGLVVTVRSTAVWVRHRAETAADLAALAAAAQIGVAEPACAAATAIAAANSAVLRTCSTRLAPDGRSGVVRVLVRCRVRLALVGWVSVDASARAGRDPPSASGPAPTG